MSAGSLEEVSEGLVMAQQSLSVCACVCGFGDLGTERLFCCWWVETCQRFAPDRVIRPRPSARAGLLFFLLLPLLLLLFLFSLLLLEGKNTRREKKKKEEKKD